MTESNQQNPSSTPRARVLSGMRPTGRLHLGNYMGALYNWVQLQHEYECYFFIADYHALTTDYADTSKLKENVQEVALDFLSAGLDPKRCTIFIQSHVPQHAELHLLLSMFTPLSLLERVPSYKDQQEQLREKDLATYGFLGYPLLQSADILLYQPDFVPVGQDQAAHVELTREVARRFNQLYSPKRLVGTDAASLAEEPDPARLILPEPEVLLTPTPKLPGIDGRKMSKSYGNSILLSDVPGSVLEKMSRMTNGGQRNPQSKPGNPDICPVGDMHALFSKPMVNDMIRERCKTAEIHCVQCKEIASASINLHLHPIRERREQLEKNPDEVWSILERGAAEAVKRAEATMDQVRSVTGLSRNRPISSQVKRAFVTSESSREGHDLSLQTVWWDQEPNLRAKNVRDYWLSSIVPVEVKLTQDSDRVFVTWKKKRVYVTTSREDLEGRWGFEAKPKSYELLALLCWDKELTLHDFIVPQVVYQAPWTAYKKAHKDENLIFWMSRSGSQYYLELPGAEPIEITAYRGQYGPMN
ncbi:tryptophan--tRNA ligase [Granulicella arctica]|uniref:Tryptophan--tRNA ligase n=1 Tax=Granulicella arctica TaxID=940613 RepID=A0A7Y9PG37_9BACT|nr:tryptophan--tRNA ligase [Granulicella arctica]NYF79202.1 tryptophanyl-tRNA synthetase [Granulicella arctica]